MKLSIVIAVLDSHEIVRRYLLYLKSLDLPDTVETIIVDDGSNPPIQAPEPLRTTKLMYTNDTRSWTQGLARMKGIKESVGEYILCTDIDHIVSKEAIDASLLFQDDKMIFRRRFAYLDEEGKLINDRDSVISWGLDPKAIRDDNLSDGVHGNTWLMRRTVFDELGGYNLNRCNSGSHLQGEDREFNKRYAHACRDGKYKDQVLGSFVYFFPSGRYHIDGNDNPHGLFHTLNHTKWGEK